MDIIDTSFCPICYGAQIDDNPRRYNHRATCSNRPAEDLLADIEWFKTGRIKVRNDAALWQAKFHTLRLENNGLRRRLRRRLRKQAAPAPQWHNPAGLGEFWVGRGLGWRFLVQEETTLPYDAQCWNPSPDSGWFEVGDCGHPRFIDKSLTYRTKAPLPK